MRYPTLIIFVLLLSPGVLAALPTLNGYVNDFAGVITPDWESRITSLITEIEKNTTAEIAVVTIHSLEGESIEYYAVKLFEQEGIGKADKDNGLLILVAVEDRKYRFEVGYGLEEFVPDASKVVLGDRIITPYFREGNYGEGIYLSIVAVGKMIQGQEDIISSIERKDASNTTNMVSLIIFIIILLAISRGGFIFLPIFMGGGNRGGGFGGGGFGGFGGGMSGGGGFSGGW